MPPESDDLHLEFLLFAQAINFSTDRRLNIMGEFTFLDAPKVPSLLPALNVAFRLTGLPDSMARERVVVVRVHAPDGSELVRNEATIDAELPEVLERAKREDLQAQITSSLSFLGLVIPTYGRYSVHLDVDGAEIAARTLLIKRPATPSD